MFFNPPKQAARNKQFQEIKKKIASFSHLSSKSLIKMPLQVFFEARSYKKYLDIKKTGREPYKKLGRI